MSAITQKVGLRLSRRYPVAYRRHVENVIAGKDKRAPTYTETVRLIDETMQASMSRAVVRGSPTP